MKRILIGYVTKTGTTKEAAEKLAELLAAGNEEKMQIDVHPLEQITDPAAYDEVYLGSPIHGMQVLPEYSSFISSHEEELTGRLKGIFIITYLYPNCGNFWRRLMRRGPQKISAQYRNIPIGIFGGKSDGSMPSFARFLFGLPPDAPLDSRTDGEIETWAGRLGE